MRFIHIPSSIAFSSISAHVITYAACAVFILGLTACDESLTPGTTNEVPVVTTDVLSVDEDSSVISDDVLANDTDPEGGELTITGYSQPDHGVAVYNDDNTFTYTPDADYNGEDAFTYTASDPEGGSSIGTVEVVVAPVNDPPIANPDTVSYSPGLGRVIDVLGNDTDPDGDALTLRATMKVSAHGGTIGTTEGLPQAIVYTPPVGFAGTDTFTYGAADAGGEVAYASVTVFVGPITLLGDEAEDRVGDRICFAGDLDGDGFDDIAVSCKATGTAGRRRAVAIFYGSPNGIDDRLVLSNADAILCKDAVVQSLGYSISAAGDVDGDGFDDVLVGEYQDDTVGFLGGVAYLVHGSATRLHGELAIESVAATFVTEAAEDQAGRVVAGVGDVNGDGYADFVVCAAQHDTPNLNCGATYLFYGGPSGFAGSISLADADAKITGAMHSGTNAAPAGDVNGDGYADFLVTGLVRSNRGISVEMQVHLFYGSPDGCAGLINLTDADAHFIAEAPADYVGKTGLGPAGDVNADGYDDILIGALDYDGTGTSIGAAYLIYGPVYGDVPLARADARFVGTMNYDIAGAAVHGAGDFNQDGFADLVISAPGANGTLADSGVVYFVPGPVYGSVTLTEVAIQMSGRSTSAKCGSAVDGGGDFNGDGFPDMLVGSYQYDEALLNRGAAYIIYGPIVANDL
jgi:hypothetical protein